MTVKINTAHAEADHQKKAAGILTGGLFLGILVSVVASAVFAWLWDQVKDRDRLTTGFDRSLLWWMFHHRTPWVTSLAEGLAWMGSPPVIVSVAVVAALLGLVWHKTRGAAWTLPIAVMGAGVIIQGIKITFQRPRPDFFTPLLHEKGFSFPSGHSLIAIVVYGLIGYFVMHFFHGHRARVAVGVLTGLLVFLIGLSRVYVGVHYPTDVLAGWTVGLPWLITCLGIHEGLTRRFAGAGEPVLHNPPASVRAAGGLPQK